jgi:putative tryptophan/tyrosine transport system substrate-binding protein
MQFHQWKRRELIRLIGGAAAWPLAARAQQATNLHRVAIARTSGPVADISETGDYPTFPALFKELRRLGYVEGKNLIVERYSSEGRPEGYVELAREVVRSQPHLIVAVSSPLVLRFKALTNTIPVVGIMADPVAYGIVPNLARPGGNITGISVDAGLEIWAKRLQILKELVPTVAKAGYLNLHSNWDQAQGRAVQEAARGLGISLSGPPLQSPAQETEYRRVLGAMSREHLDGLVVGDIADNLAYRRLIINLVEIARLPTVYPYRSYFDEGGLMVYGSDLAQAYRWVAGYVDRILRGAKPGELPIYLESKFELLINLRAAKALGVTVPTSLLVRANEVLE